MEYILDLQASYPSRGYWVESLWRAYSKIVERNGGLINVVCEETFNGSCHPSRLIGIVKQIPDKIGFQLVQETGRHSFCSAANANDDDAVLVRCYTISTPVNGITYDYQPARPGGGGGSPPYLICRTGNEAGNEELHLPLLPWGQLDEKAIAKKIFSANRPTDVKNPRSNRLPLV